MKTNSLASVAKQSRLMNVDEVAELLSVSSRHTYRLADSGRMPSPMKLGGACRWDREVINDWIEGGCKPVATEKQGADHA